jgi:hypothetical protein
MVRTNREQSIPVGALAALLGRAHIGLEARQIAAIINQPILPDGSYSFVPFGSDFPGFANV